MRSSPKISKEFVDILIDLRDACSHNLPSTENIYSQLLFNGDLWFGGVSNSIGVALHGALLPLLSSLAKSSPNRALACVDVKEMINLIHEYTTVDNTKVGATYES